MLISFSLLPAACGGGGGSAVNHAPVVFAGADFTITVASAGVPLTATISDPDGNPLTVQWILTGFTASALTPAGSAAGTATFVSGSQSAAAIVTLTTVGLYTFQVTASDGTLSASDVVVVDFTNELIGVLPPSLRDAPVPLNTIPVVPASAEVAGSGLNQYIPDTIAARAAVVKLGKALFWDMQVGSNGQACATCHFHAGADNRIANTMSRGPNSKFNFVETTPPVLTDIGPNQMLTSALFPLHLFNTPDDRFSGVLRTTDDVVGAEGVFDRVFKFNGLTPGSGIESSLANVPFPDANGFAVGGVNVRRVTGRNAPTAINAVFNLRNFLDGRARHHFNGVNPFGNLDTVVTTPAGTPILRTAVPFVAGSVPAPFVVTGLNKSSLASQAVGPPTSDFEMSHGTNSAVIGSGIKDFPTLGKKLLDPALVALGTQLVDPTDSVLTAVSLSPANGISDKYTALIQAAFAPEFWNSNHKYTLVGGLPIDGGVGVPATQIEFTMMEVNFSLFFGLAVQMYESTLVADQTPFDAFLGSIAPYTRANLTTAGMQATGAPIASNPAAMTASEKAGMRVFFGKGLCFNCHGGPELTLAGVNALGLIGVPGEVPEFPVEKMVGGQAGQQGTLDFASAGATNNPGTVVLDFDPRGKRIEISFVPAGSAPGTAPVVVYDSVFPGVASVGGAAQQLAIGLTATAVPPIGGIATADFSILAGGSRILAISLAQSITNPPTFPPLGTYTVKVFNGPSGTVLAPAHASNNLVLTTVPLLYDLGFYNIGVRPTTDDAGLGGTAPGGLPLSLAQLAKNTGTSEFTLNPGINLATDPVSNINGAFKVPGLRNVALTGPYLHNGGKSTIEQVINHYDAGGDFHEANIVDLAPEIFELFLSPVEKANLAAFMRALTDPRVANEQAPFDHPSFRYPEGQTVAGGGATDIINSIPAVGKLGLPGLATPLPPLKPFDDPAGGSILTP